MTLTADEFVRRFLQHVLPAGVHKVRYYGLWAPANRPLLRRVQVALLTRLPSGPPAVSAGALALAVAPPATAVQPPVPAEPLPPGPARPSIPCPFCSTGTLLLLRRLPPQTRAPP
jgi:hypothetical protein